MSSTTLPMPLRIASIAWMLEAILLVRFCYVFFHDIGKTGGPGTGGLLLVIPVALASPLLAPLCLFFSWALYTGRATTFLRLISGVGAVAITFIGGPIALLLLFSVAIVFMSGYFLEALAVAGLPVFFGGTLIVLFLDPVRAWLDGRKSGAIPAPGVEGFLVAAVAVAAVSLGLPAIFSAIGQAQRDRELRLHPPLSQEQLDTLRTGVEAAVKADDGAALAAFDEVNVWKPEFYLPEQNTSGDALSLSIALRKPKAAAALLARKMRVPVSFYIPPAMQYGDEPVWLAFDAANAGLAKDYAAPSGAIARPDPDALRYLAAHGADKNALLVALIENYEAPMRLEKVQMLLRAGADPNANKRDASRDQPHPTVLALALQGNKDDIVRALLEGGADPQKKSETSWERGNEILQTPLEIINALEVPDARKNELRTILQTVKKKL